jgi:hypothetical protein
MTKTKRGKMSTFEKIRNGEYLSLDFPAQADPDFARKMMEYVVEEDLALEALGKDLLAEHGLTGNVRANLAFEVASQREGYLGFHAIVALFEDLLPLILAGDR